MSTSYDNPRGDYLWHGSSQDRVKRIEELHEEARLERIRLANAEKEKFSKDFARFCGILSGTGIGKSV